MEFLNRGITFLNGIVWGYVLVYSLLGVGLYFTIRMRFVQVRLFKRAIIVMLGGFKAATPGGISPFQAFATGLASRVGTGNIAGVAIAISMGGPGAVFWMWITALVGMASSVVECSLAQLFKVRQRNHTFRGGPAYYIQMGLGRRGLSVAFALALILCFGLVFNAVQTNTIAAVFGSAYKVPPWVVGLAIVAATAPVIFGGIHRVAVLAEFLVPLMAVLYLGIAGFCVFRHLGEIPEAIALIVRSAFGFEQAVGGFTGHTISQAMTTGIKRGLFSNEAGMGSAPNAAATATASHPVSQALLQMVGTFVDTIIVCSATAFLILLSGIYKPGESKIGVHLTEAALRAEIGPVGNHFLAIAILFFSFSSIIGNYVYAEGNVKLIRDSPRMIFIFRLLVLGMVFFGAVGSVPMVWNMADLSQATMAMINLVAIMLLSGVALKLVNDYESQLRSGSGKPVFTRDIMPELEDKLPRDVW